jgi:hypothetical protein
LFPFASNENVCDGDLQFAMKLPALLALFVALSSTVRAQALPAPASNLNAMVLAQIKEMPSGGSYSAKRVATIRLQSAAHFESGKFFVLPDAASPSFCSGATYLVFLKVIEELRDRGQLVLGSDTLGDLAIRGQIDGEGVWGRWNANGPGTARLFTELKLGENFCEFEQAQPGDFMKIFWTKEIGKAEHGHSVVFLGMDKQNGVDRVRFWSSNIPAGYGEKSVARKEIAQAIFSRLQTPGNLSRIKEIPRIDAYLAGLLSQRSSLAEARAKCGM